MVLFHSRPCQDSLSQAAEHETNWNTQHYAFEHRRVLAHRLPLLSMSRGLGLLHIVPTLIEQRSQSVQGVHGILVRHQHTQAGIVEQNLAGWRMLQAENGSSHLAMKWLIKLFSGTAKES